MVSFTLNLSEKINTLRSTSEDLSLG